MPRNIDDMIVPEKKRSIRDIPIPPGRRKVNNLSAFPPVPNTPREYNPPQIPRENFDIHRNGNIFTKILRKKGLWIASGVALAVLTFAILSVFNGATLSYVPKSAVLSFDANTYTAEKIGEGKLLYSIVKLSKDKGVEAPISGEAEVNRKASGTIIIYNNASTEPQKLVENTRFETPGGLVYRIQNAITIPGKKTLSGLVQPGSIEVMVYAAEAGDKYNIGLADFTLPGLKGGARFTTIYARSKTEMSGGFVGVEKVVKNEDKTRVEAELGGALRDELTADVTAQVPEDFILIPALAAVTFEDLPQTESLNKDSVVFNMRANFSGVMFKRTDLSNYLARSKVTIALSESVDIPELDTLAFTFVNTRSSELLISESIKFSVTGMARAVWHTDEVALRADLVGKHKRDIPSILNNYPTIVSATATVRPFWKNTFPDDSTRIFMRKISTK